MYTPTTIRKVFHEGRCVYNRIGLSLLTVERKNFLRRIKEDPAIAFRLVQMLTRQISELEEDVSVISPGRS